MKSIKEFLNSWKKLRLIEDNVHDNICYSSIERYVLSSRIFNRLHYLHQNTLAYFVYPSDKTSRFAHSIGVMHLSTEMFVHALLNANDEHLRMYINDLYNDLKNIISEEMKDTLNMLKPVLSFDDKLPDFENLMMDISELVFTDPVLRKYIGPLLNLVSSEDSEDEEAYILKKDSVVKVSCLLLVLQALRLSALLHDVGHLPGCHIMEDTLEVLAQRHKRVNNILEAYEGRSSKIHESITLAVVYAIFEEVLLRIRDEVNALDDEMGQKNIIKNDLEKYVAVLACLVKEILRITYSKEIEEQSEKYKTFLILKNILSHDIDADRFDYVFRDGMNSGLLKGSADIDRIVKLLKLYKYSCCPKCGSKGVVYIDNESKYYCKSCEKTFETVDYKYALVANVRCLNDLEQLFIDRYKIYRYLICHHKVARLDYLLQKATELLTEIEMELEDLGVSTAVGSADYNLGKITQILSVLKSMGDILEDIESGKYPSHKELMKAIYIFSPIDDYWLLTLFRFKYFELISNKNELVKKIIDKGKKTAGWSNGRIDDLIRKINQLLFILDEMFTASKRLKSLWKRDHEYYNFVSNFVDQIENKRREDLTKLLESLEDLIGEIGDLIETIRKKEKSLELEKERLLKLKEELEGYRTELEIFYDLIKNILDKNINEIIPKINTILKLKIFDDLTQYIEERLNSKLSPRTRTIEGTDVEMVGVVLCTSIIDKIKIGIEKLEILQDGRIKDFAEISQDLYKYLKSKIEMMVPFVIYYPDDIREEEIEKELRNILIEYIINKIGNKINEINYNTNKIKEKIIKDKDH